jgi:hypothetical protein
LERWKFGNLLLSEKNTKKETVDTLAVEAGSRRTEIGKYICFE